MASNTLRKINQLVQLKGERTQRGRGGGEREREWGFAESTLFNQIEQVNKKKEEKD